ncbi:MAG: hypothetical protein IPK25_08260 [Saprospiraceae bacterium]|nr:hypothetical protein [Saprospiraceae bacterium]
MVNCMIITSIFIQCRSVKTETKDQRSLGVDEGYNKERKDAAYQQDTMFLYCNDFRGYLDNKTKNIIAYNNGTIEYCLREKAFAGDSASVQQVAELISSMRHPFGTFNQRLRGEKIFKAVLERLNNFEFVINSNGEKSDFTFYNRYGRVLVDMIDVIDGVSYGEYMRIHLHESMKNIDSTVDIRSREFNQISSRLSWEIYKEAYDKGLIKLKDFGQE